VHISSESLHRIGSLFFIFFDKSLYYIIFVSTEATPVIFSYYRVAFVALEYFCYM